MKKIQAMIMFIFMLMLLTGCAVENDVLVTAQVESIIDGDTIVVEIEDGKEEKVRFTLVDTPEMNDRDNGIQPFAQEATNYTKEQLAGKTVMLELDIEERDQYGRILAYIWLEDTLFNESLVEKGFARVAVFPPNTKYFERMKEAEERAKASRVGIWSLDNYVHEKGFANSGMESLGEKEDNSGECENQIKGNKNSKIYHLPTGVHYNEVSQQNIVWFCTEDEAKKAGYRPAKN